MQSIIYLFIIFDSYINAQNDDALNVKYYTGDIGVITMDLDIANIIPCYIYGDIAFTQRDADITEMLVKTLSCHFH